MVWFLLFSAEIREFSQEKQQKLMLKRRMFFFIHKYRVLCDVYISTIFVTISSASGLFWNKKEIQSLPKGKLQKENQAETKGIKIWAAWAETVLHSKVQIFFCLRFFFLGYQTFVRLFKAKYFLDSRKLLKVFSVPKKLPI